MKKYLNRSQLKKIGFIKIGKNNKISKTIRTYNFKGILGSNNRIDDDVILKGIVNLRNNIHIGRGCTLSGNNFGIEIDDFVSLSNYVQIFCMSDNYKGSGLSGGTLKKNQRSKYSESYKGPIKIGKCCIVGPFSIILPNSIINNFSSCAAMSIISGTIKKGVFVKNKKIFNKNYKKIEKLYKIFTTNS